MMQWKDLSLFPGFVTSTGAILMAEDRDNGTGRTSYPLRISRFLHVLTHMILLSWWV